MNIFITDHWSWGPHETFKKLKLATQRCFSLYPSVMPQEGSSLRDFENFLSEKRKYNLSSNNPEVGASSQSRVCLCDFCLVATTWPHLTNSSSLNTCTQLNIWAVLWKQFPYVVLKGAAGAISLSFGWHWWLVLRGDCALPVNSSQEHTFETQKTQACKSSFCTM